MTTGHICCLGTYTDNLLFTLRGDIDGYEELNKAVAKNRNFALAYYHRGNVYRDKGDTDNAIKDYTAALRINPSYTLALNNRGSIYGGYAKKEYDRAIADFTAALRHDPNFVEALLNRAQAYNQKEDYDRAIADCNTGLRISPNNVFFFLERADAYFYKDDYEHAFADYDEAIRIAPNNYVGYSSRGLMYSFLVDILGVEEFYDAAIADYSQALQLIRNDEFRVKDKRGVIYFSRAKAYEGKGDYKLAIADYSSLIDISDSASAYYYLNRALMYLKIGDHDRAFEDFDEAEYIEPNNASIFYSRGDANYANGDYFSALLDYKEAVRLDPSHFSYKNAIERIRKLDLPDPATVLPPPSGRR